MDGDSEQAECVVRAIERFLDARNSAVEIERELSRDFLVRTLATMISMSEPRNSDLQK